MTAEDYSAILQRAGASLESVTNDIRIVGDGPAKFLTAAFGDRSLELYASGSTIIVDPAIGEELQGERPFHTLEEALSFASDWLTHKA